MRSETWGRETTRDVLRGVAWSLPILVWPFFARPGVVFLAGTYLLVLAPLMQARTATQLIVILFAYYGVDGYLRLLFDYNWFMYLLPLLAAFVVYVRWFFGPLWRNTPGAFTRSPIGLPLIGLFVLYLLEMFNGVPFNPIVSVGGLAYHLGSVPLFFVAATGFRDLGRVRAILWFIVVLVIFECTYALGQYYLGAPEALALSQHYQARIASEAWWIPGTYQLIYRPTGLTLSGGGPGLYGVIGVVLALGLLQGRSSGLGIRLTLPLGLLIMLVAVFLSAIRAFWLSLIIALVVYSLLQSIRYLTLAALLGWGAAAIAIKWTQGALYARLSTLFQPWALFSQERGGDILTLPKLVLEHPFGIGLGRAAGSAAGRAIEMFPEGAYGGAHNYWVSLAWEATIIAPVLLGWLLWRLGWFGLSLLRRVKNSETRAIIAAILALDTGIVAMTFAGPALAGLASSFAQYFWFLSGLLVALSSNLGESPVTVDLARKEPIPPTQSSPLGRAV